MTSPFFHRAYDLTFGCEFELPELPLCAASAAPDVLIEVGNPLSPAHMERAARDDSPIEAVTRYGAQSSYVLFDEVGGFTISDGRHILIEPLEGTSPSTWRLPLLGAVLALLLEQRGHFLLHAGALDLGGFAAAFLGEKGQGKSTLNAALSRAGYGLLSDDLVALDWPEAGFPLALCGFGQIKVVPDAARAVLGGEPGDWPAVAPELADMSKRSFMAPLAAKPLPLRHLFVLSSIDDDDTGASPIRLRVLTPQDALIQLMPHTFGARFGDLYLQDARKKTHFQSCARIVSECRVWELARRRDLKLLPATIESIARATETL